MAPSNCIRANFGVCPSVLQTITTFCMQCAQLFTIFGFERFPIRFNIAIVSSCFPTITFCLCLHGSLGGFTIIIMIGARTLADKLFGYVGFECWVCFVLNKGQPAERTDTWYCWRTDSLCQLFMCIYTRCAIRHIACCTNRAVVSASNLSGLSEWVNVGSQSIVCIRLVSSRSQSTAQASSAVICNCT